MTHSPTPLNAPDDARGLLDRITPRPWFTALSPVRQTLCVMAGNTWICGELQAQNETAIASEETTANATLIAMAPDLLADNIKLRAALEAICAQDAKPEQSGRYAQLQAVIAAARAALGDAP